MSDRAGHAAEVASARSRFERHLPSAAGFAVLTAAVLWPAVVHFRTRPMVDGVDAAMFEWLWWAMPRAVADGSNPFTTDLIFHPVGADLALTTSAPLVSAVTWPVQAALGPAAQINLVQLVAMFTAGFVTYLLAHRCCRNRGASFVAGMAYALLPHRFAHVDSHLNLVETAMLPLGCLALLAFVERPTWRRSACLGAVVAAAFLIEPQLALLMGFCLVPLALVHRHRLVSAGRQVVGAVACALLLASPLLVPMVVSMATGGVGEPHPTAASLVYSASPLSWVVPPLDRLALGEVVSLDPITYTTEGIAYPGLLLLGLAVAGTRLVERDRRKGWIAMGLVGFVLSLGPYLYVRGTYIELPLPFFLLRLVPGLDAMRAPGRFALVGALAVHVLGAMVLAEYAKRFAARAIGLLVVAGAITLLELLPGSLPSRPDPIPEAYEALADDPDPGAVLEIPLKWSTTQRYLGFDGGQRRDFMFMVYATVHGRPITSGAVSRFPDHDLERLMAIPLYRQLLAAGDEAGFDDPLAFDRPDLVELGIGFVAYHRDDPQPDVLDHIRSLGLPVLADDGTTIIWKVGSE